MGAGSVCQHDIRKIIKQHKTAKNLNDFDICGVASQNEDPLGRGRPSFEYWLTEEAALFIVTKSETPKAVALTREMIRVFKLARQGLSPEWKADLYNIIRAQGESFATCLLEMRAQNDRQNAIVQAHISELSESVRLARVDNDVLRAKVIELTEIVQRTPQGVINAFQAQWIAGQIDVIATMRVQLGKNPTFRSARGYAQSLVSAAAEWGGRGLRRVNMPADRFPQVKTCLEVHRKDLEAESKRLGLDKKGGGENGAPPIQQLSLWAPKLSIVKKGA